jgi:hypothetical protein
MRQEENSARHRHRTLLAVNGTIPAERASAFALPLALLAVPRFRRDNHVIVGRADVPCYPTLRKATTDDETRRREGDVRLREGTA